MVLHPAQVHDEPLEINGVLPPEVLELNDPLAKAYLPVEATLLATRDEKDILVTGTLRTVVQVSCGRCAEWMEFPVEVTDFMVEFESPTESTIRLTPFIREDILLSLPLKAECELDAKFKCPLTGKKFAPKAGAEKPITGKDTWKALDQLKKKLKD